MENVNCNLCNSSKVRLLYQKPDEFYFPSEYFNVVECEECGLGFVNPRPRINEMSRYYPPLFYSDLREAASRQAEINRFSTQADYIMRAIPRTGERPRLLDVGSASGDFVRFMCARGFDAEGVEPSSDGEAKAGLRIFSGLFTEFQSCSPDYHAITAWAVLEHVHDPKSYFRKASQLLIENGVFIFMIPNFESLASRKLFAEDIPRHLYFFTRDNILRYADQTGFNVELADQSNPIFVHNPHRALHYYLTKISGRKWTWPPPLSYSEFLKIKRLERGVISFFLFAIAHPIGLMDRILAPILGQCERLAGKYMVSVYVLRKKSNVGKIA